MATLITTVTIGALTAGSTFTFLYPSGATSSNITDSGCYVVGANGRQLQVPSEVKFAYGPTVITATLNNGTLSAGVITVYLNVPTAASPDAVVVYDATGVMAGIGAGAGPAAVLGLPQICAIPVFLQSSGTIGDNGALSALTALAFTYTSCYMYFPVDKIAVGVPAGLYYVVMSSTTAGQIFNNTYNPLLGAFPTIPASPTAFVSTGPGAYVQTTAADIVLLGKTIPANSMGPNGGIFIDTAPESNSNANSKTSSIYLGATKICNCIVTTVVAARWLRSCVNRGVANKQTNILSSAANAMSSSNPADNPQTAIDTTVDQVLTWKANLAVATDWMAFQQVRVDTVFR